MTKKRKIQLGLLIGGAALVIAGVITAIVLIASSAKDEAEPVGSNGEGGSFFGDFTSSSVAENPQTETADGSSDTQPPQTQESDEQTSTEASQSASEATLKANCALISSWNDGSGICTQLDVSIKNDGKSAASDWKAEISVPSGSQISQSWNAKFSINDTILTITSDGNGSDIAPGASVSCGFILKTPSEFKPTSVTINGTATPIENSGGNNNGGNNNVNNNNNGGNNNNNGAGSQVEDTDVITNVDTEAILERCDDAVQGDDWLHTDGRKIYDKNGKEVWLTGCNWFGYNTGTNIFDGVWNCNLENSLASIADHGFNLLRIPFSAQLINQWAAGEYPTANFNGASNPKLSGMNSLEIFDYVVTLCEANGMKIMIDIHCAETNASGHTVNLWYTDKVSTKQYYAALEWMAARYKNNDTIIAYDLKNEPHGKEFEGSAAAIWNSSTAANNWKYVAETAAQKVLAKNPNVLIMVEGIEIYPKNIKTNNFTSTSKDDYYYNWWGGNLRGVADYPINLGKYQNKLVYSPHDYGPTVYLQPWFESSYDYNSLMKDCWKDNWFFIYEKDIAPLLIGEWGGYMTEPNITWMTYMRQLIKKYHLNHTFWCFNANSGDTGGLVLDDFTTWDTQKYNFVKEVLWQEGGKFVGLDHEIPLGKNGITLKDAKGL